MGRAGVKQVFYRDIFWLELLHIPFQYFSETPFHICTPVQMFQALKTILILNLHLMMRKFLVVYT